jgi:hypothetical protein
MGADPIVEGDGDYRDYMDRGRNSLLPQPNCLQHITGFLLLDLLKKWHVTLSIKPTTSSCLITSVLFSTQKFAGLMYELKACTHLPLSSA